MNWELWRIVSSDHFTVSLVEIQTKWSLDDLLDAHITLDLLEDAEQKRQPRR